MTRIIPSPPIHLIRHTQVTVEHGICYGQLDVDLAESFAAETLAVARKIEKLTFASTYCSPLRRCLLLAQRLDLRPQTDARLMEMNFGQWEGQPWEAIYTSKQGKRWFDDYWTTSCPGGESFENLVDRVTDFLQELSLLSAPKGNAPYCLITHAGVIRATLTILCQVPPTAAFDIQVPYGHIISIENGRFSFL